MPHPPPPQNLRQFPCPFSPGRLRELHWTQRKTLREIGIAAQEIEGWEYAPSPATVQRWMREAAVPTRTPSQAQRLAAQVSARTGRGMYSPESKQKARQATQQHRRPILVGGHLVYPNAHRRIHTAATRAHLSAVALRRRRSDYWVTRACDWCTHAVTRPHWQMRAATVFCNHACAARGSARQREQQGPGGKLTRPCDWCATPITRMASQMQSPRVYCGPSCLNKYRWKHTEMQSDAQKERLVAANRRRGQEQRAKRLLRYCAQCGAPIERNEAQVQTDTPCCSRACAAQYLRQARSQAQHDRYEAKLLHDRAARAQQAEQPQTEALLDVGQVAEMLGQKENTIRSWAKRGKLIPVQSKPCRLFRLSDARALLSNRSHAAVKAQEAPAAPENK